MSKERDFGPLEMMEGAANIESDSFFLFFVSGVCSDLVGFWKVFLFFSLCFPCLTKTSFIF